MNTTAIKTLFLAGIFLLMFNNISSAQTVFLPFKTGANISERMPVKTMLAQSVDFVEMEYLFSGAEVLSKTRQDKVFQHINVSGFGSLHQVGKPALPAHTEFIAAPIGSTVKLIIEDVEYIDYNGYYIYPALKPASDKVGAGEPQFEIDQKLYFTDEFFPSAVVAITAIQKLRNIPLALAEIRPVQFNPVSGKIRVYSKIKFRLVFAGAEKSYEKIANGNSIGFTNILKNIVTNNASVPDGKATANAKSITKNYIIITPDIYKNAADTLAKWKMQLGYTVDVVSKSSWTADQVRDSIHNRYQNWTPRPDYFAILGDVDKVPADLIAPDNFATDLYFACMDGPGDYIPDMAHGRISVSSAIEALRVVKKIIGYEKNPPSNSSYYSTATNCAQYQDDDANSYEDRRFTLTAEQVHDYLGNNFGYNINRVYFTDASATPLFWNNDSYAAGEPVPSYLQKPGFAWNGSGADVVNEINAGRFYILHRDHGYEAGWGEPDFSTSNIPALTNAGKLPVMFSINCSSGAFGTTACFAEEILRKDGGGVAGVFAASNTSYSGYNDALSLGMFDAIWAVPGLIPNFTGYGAIQNPVILPHSNIRTMGDVMNQGLIRMEETWGAEQYTHEIFHYHGDPAMKIWTAQPLSLTAVYPSSVNCNATSITITNSSCLDAMATIYFNGNLIGQSILSAGAGSITFAPVTNITPTLTLTLSKEGYIPFVAEIPVNGCVYPPVCDFSSSEDNLILCGGSTNSVSLNDGSIYGPTGWLWTVTPGTYNFINSTNSNSQNPEVVFTALGTYSIKLKATNAFGGDSLTKINYITVNSGASLPLVEGFESGTFPPEKWSIDNPDGALTWQLNTSSTGNGSSTASAEMNCWSYPTTGQKDGLLSPLIDLSTITDAKMTFNVAYKKYPGYYDTLKIYASTDCGTTWLPTPLYSKWGSALETAPNASGPFHPSLPEEWRNETVNLASLAGSSVILKFVCVNGYGDNLYIDDINIFSGSVPPVAGFTASATDLTCNALNTAVTFFDNSGFVPTSWLWTFTPSTVTYMGGTNAGSQNPQVKFNNIGSYDVKLVASNLNGSDTITKFSYIVLSNIVTLPFTENFEVSLFPPSGWKMENPDAGITWVRENAATGLTGSSASAWMNFYNYYPAEGQADNLISPSISLAGSNNPRLSFFVAYRIFSNYSDSLKVFVSNDCGATWGSGPVYSKTGTVLETAPGSGNFTPGTSGEWRQEEIDLTAFAGDEILVKFQAINGYGNNLFIDNINIDNIVSVDGNKEADDILIFPVPASNSINIKVSAINRVNYKTLKISNVVGQEVVKIENPFNSSELINLNIKNFTEGIYFINIDGVKGSSFKGKFEVIK